MIDSITLDIETVKLIQKEMRDLRLLNEELRGQLMAVHRTVNNLHAHLPKESSVEYVPTSVSILNRLIEKEEAKTIEKPKKVKEKK